MPRSSVQRILRLILLAALSLSVAAVPAAGMLREAANEPDCVNTTQTMGVMHGTTLHHTIACSAVDPANNPVIVEITQQAGNGQFTDLGNGEFQWTPNMTFAGEQTVGYTATDGANNTVSGTMTVVSENAAPTCEALQFEVHTGDEHFTSVVCSDTDYVDTLTYSVSTQATKGTATFANASSATVAYAANEGVKGADSFKFRANDGITNSAPATASVTITNAAPTCVAPTEAAVAHKTAITIYVSCSDADDVPTVSASTQPTKGTLSAFDPNSNSFTYTPNAGASGADSFQYTATDGVDTSDAYTQPINVANALPTCAPTSPLETHANTPLTVSVPC